MRTADWPQKDDFLQTLDRLKDRHGIRYDSALAEAAGISHTAISNWRLGKVRPSTTALTRLAEALEEEPTVLIVAAGLMTLPDPHKPAAPELPDELQRLGDLYRRADETRKSEILGHVRFVLQWAEATAPAPEPGTTTRGRRKAV